uniref:High affinity choline transporter 1 n=1 Tax=Varanus komodoensis TaxID=61221 RepID=A0A8D2KY28_VARKO
MGLNVSGLVALVVFYLLTLATGIWASRKTKKEKSQKPSEVAIVGDRNMNFCIALFTATATGVGGAYINGTAELVYLPSRGLVWVQAPVGLALSLLVGGLFFVKPMRTRNYVTLMDPIQESYRNVMASLLFIPPLIADVFWFAAILASLGATMEVILDIQVILYTFLGGLYSVAYTDVIQLVFITISLWMCIPFALMNSATQSISFTAAHDLFQAPWIGKVEMQYFGRWIDDFLYLVLGGIPWQSYFQRVLSVSSLREARLMSYLAGLGCFAMAVPSVLIGAVAASTDWNQTRYGLPSPSDRGDAALILPLVLHYLCPHFSKMELSPWSQRFITSALFSFLFSQATEKGVLWVMRASMVMFGAAAAGLAFYSHSIFDLWFLGGELVYALLFPQLCCALFVPGTNTYGSAAGFFLGFLLRLLAGEPSLKIPPVIHYPGCSLVGGTYIQLFPFKMVTMLVSLFTILSVSYLAASMFKSGTFLGVAPSLLEALHFRCLFDTELELFLDSKALLLFSKAF